MTHQMHLTAFMRPVSVHAGAWRYPGAQRDANFDLSALRQYAQKLERACFDAFFMADHLGVLDMPMEALKRSHTVTSFEPFTLLSALAMVTERIGLVATASTTYDEPFHVARRFASLDRISGGRAGWNVVTTANPDTAANFGAEPHLEHALRYRRAREFHQVVTGLWDSFADDAFVRDAESGIFFDPDRLRTLDHHGEHFTVRGPLNIARPPQGWPVIFQAGASEPGRDLAAGTAEVIFESQPNMGRAVAFRSDMRDRALAAGRSAAPLVLPAAMIFLGETGEDARAKKRLLDGLVHYDSGIHTLSSMLGFDVSGYDPDGPLPEIPDTNGGKATRERMIAVARDEGLTIRQLAALAGSYGGLGFVGTAAEVADQMETWIDAGAADGFTVMFPYLPMGLDDVVSHLVPELQRRGRLRTRYEGTTLRDHLGLVRPANQFFPTSRGAEHASAIDGTHALAA